MKNFVPIYYQYGSWTADGESFTTIKQAYDATADISAIKYVIHTALLQHLADLGPPDKHGVPEALNGEASFTWK